MWQRFTERARRVVFFAQEEAGKLGENYVSTEHLLLGLVRERDSVAARMLGKMGIALERVRDEVQRQVTRGDGRLGQDMQLTPRAKRVIDLAYDEARQFDSDHIGTEHLLLGLIREGEGMAGRILTRIGADLERARRTATEMQAEEPQKKTESGRAWSGVPRHIAAREIADDVYELRGKSLLSITDFTREQIEGVLVVAAAIHQDHTNRRLTFRFGYPKSLAMIFEKPSLRTRVTFDLGMRQMGGLTTILGPQEIGLGSREAVPDVARNLERMVDVIMARVFNHQTLVDLRDNCKIPIINGLSDLEHPCQILADLYTVQQKKGKLEGIKLAWVGDGYNVLNSLLLGGALTGMTIAAACPKGYWPKEEIVQQARELAGDASKIIVTDDPAEAVQDADAVYTDVWTSMGQEKEQLARIQAFRPFQVNTELMAKAKPDAIFLHCLPAHRGDEVTDEVMDGPQSVVFDQAENRLHAQKAVLALVTGL